MYTDEADGKERELFMYNHVVSHTARHWAQDFIGFMQTCINEQSSSSELRSGAAIPPLLNSNIVLASFKRAKQRLVVLGVGGCLTRWHPLMKPELDVKPLSKSRPKLATALSKLANDNNTIVLLVSSLGREQLNKLIDVSGNGLWLAAENGYYLQHHDKQQQNNNTATDQVTTEEQQLTEVDTWKSQYHNIDFSWKEGVMRVFEHFAERTPGTYIKQQDTFISWHYDTAHDKVFAESQAALVVSHLTGGPLNNTPTEVLHIKPNNSNTDNPKEQGAVGNCIMVRPLGVSKGAAVRTLMSKLVKAIKLQSANNGSTIGLRYSIDSNVNSDISDDDDEDAITLLPNNNSSVATTTESSPAEERKSLNNTQQNFTKRRPSQLNTDQYIDRHKYPFDFMLVCGSFLNKDEDIFGVADDYSSEGSSTIKTGGQPKSPALTSRSTRSPIVRGMNASARNLAAMVNQPLVAASPRHSGTYSTVDANDSVAIGTTQSQQLSNTSSSNESAPRDSLMDKLNKLQLNSVNNPNSSTVNRHNRGLSQTDDETGQPLTFLPDAGRFMDYSIPSPSMGAQLHSPVPQFGMIASSRARSSSSTQDIIDDNVHTIPKQRLLNTSMRGKPSVFTASVGNVASKAQNKLIDTYAVENLIHAMGNALTQ